MINEYLAIQLANRQSLLDCIDEMIAISKSTSRDGQLSLDIGDTRQIIKDVSIRPVFLFAGIPTNADGTPHKEILQMIKDEKELLGYSHTKEMVTRIINDTN